jgi:hypothetical protein
MAICSCVLPVLCCQPAVAGGVIYADLWGELSTHLAQQALFTQSSVHDATAASFPLSKHLGRGDSAPAFSGLRVYLQFMLEVGLPPSPVEFSSLCHSHKLSRTWLLSMRHPSPTRPGLFIYSSGRDSPLPLQSSGFPTLFAMCLYCSYCLLPSFSFFPG